MTILEKYPFMRVKDNSVYPWLTRDDCWLDDMPEGWMVAFGEQMCEELKAALGKYADYWIIVQVKEKFGRLCIYYGWDTFDEDIEIPDEVANKVDDIVNKYEVLSGRTCMHCGSRATYQSVGWIGPYCEKCKPSGSIKMKE